MLRKPASDSGWDWGPAFSPAGLPGRVELLLLRAPLLRGEMRGETLGSGVPVAIQSTFL